MTKRIFHILLPIVAVAAAIAALVYFLNSRPLEVQVAEAEKNIPIQVFGLGTIEAQVHSSIGFEVGAAITELAADHGSIVKRGDVLARLNSAEQQSRMARAEAGVRSAEAALTRTSAMVDRQAAVLVQKDETNRRQQDLLKNRVVSIEKAEESAKDLKVADADHALAMADVAVSRAALETARADLNYETTLLDHHTLRAPFDAIVVERHRELGAVVKAGDPVYTVVDPNSVWVLAHVEEARAGPITLGQVAEVQLRSLPGRLFKGHVARIGIESDRVSEERRVWIKCDECPADFHLGEQTEVIITVVVLPEARLVPELMVSGYDGRDGNIWIADNGVASRISVPFGLRSLDGRLQVTGGLPQGADIITGPTTGLREGRAIKIVDGRSP